MRGTANRLPIQAALPFLILSVLENFAPIYPMYMIMLRSRGMEYETLALLLVIWSAPVVLLEIPSGILADRWDKRGVIAIGMAMKAAGFLCWILWPGFAGACAGFILWGGQEAFCSGSRQALLYETLRLAGREGEYEKTAGACECAGMIAIAASMASGGFLYARSPALALAVSGFSAALGACAALSLKRSGEPRDRALRGVDGPRALLAPLRSHLATLRPVLAKPGMAGLIAAACLAGAAFGTAEEYDGLWSMERYGIPLGFVGLWSVLPFGARGLGGALAGKVAGLMNRGRWWFPGALFASGFLFASAAFLPGIWGAAPYLCSYLLVSALAVVFEGRIQAAAADESRATLISASNLAMTLCAMGLSPLFGAAASRGGLGAAFTLIGVVCAIAAAVLGTFGRGKKTG